MARDLVVKVIAVFICNFINLIFRILNFGNWTTNKKEYMTRLLPQYASCYMSGEAANQSSLLSNLMYHQ